VEPASVEMPLDDPGFVELAVAGSWVAGEFRCADCRYGVVVQRVLPPCPMCGGAIWESRGPFGSPRRAD
jgi:hypothetical protein